MTLQNQIKSCIGYFIKRNRFDLICFILKKCVEKWYWSKLAVLDGYSITSYIMTLRLAARRGGRARAFCVAWFPEERGINAAHVSVSSVPTGPVAAVYYPGRQTRHTWQSAISSIESRATGTPVQSSTLSTSFSAPRHLLDLKILRYASSRKSYCNQSSSFRSLVSRFPPFWCSQRRFSFHDKGGTFLFS